MVRGGAGQGGYVAPERWKYAYCGSQLTEGEPEDYDHKVGQHGWFAYRAVHGAELHINQYTKRNCI